MDEKSKLLKRLEGETKKLHKLLRETADSKRREIEVTEHIRHGDIVITIWLGQMMDDVAKIIKENIRFAVTTMQQLEIEKVIPPSTIEELQLKFEELKKQRKAVDSFFLRSKTITDVTKLRFPLCKSLKRMLVKMDANYERHLGKYEKDINTELKESK